MKIAKFRLKGNKLFSNLQIVVLRIFYRQRNRVSEKNVH